jgi:2',3'-cyclic-nucleotide 2'-phosphodiesterase (5'-nucleotidase family)
MLSPGTRRRVLLLLLAPLLAALSVATAPPRPGSSGRRVTLTLLSTTDIHGHVEPWHYLTGRPANLGLAKIATLVRQVRAQEPHVLLFDCGDAIEGTPLAYYFARKDTAAPNPTVAAMNAMRYDAMALGNHEFNFGLDVLWRAKGEANFPWLAANLRQEWTAGVRHFAPYIIERIAGVRVGIVGFVTPGIPHWEVPAHYRGYQFEPIVEAARRVIPELRPKVDLLVALVHSGLDRDPETGRPLREIYPGENVAWELAEEVPGIDVIFFGHTHRELPEKFIHGVLLAQAKNWGESLAEAEVTLAEEPGGRWRVLAKHSRTIRVTSRVAPDPKIMKLAAPYQTKVERFLNTPVGLSPAALTGTFARLEDDPLVDVIQKVQMEAGHADVSLATLFDPRCSFPAGTITIRQVFALYLYDNWLDTVEMTGAELRRALEHAASFYPQWPFSPGRIRLPDYNADSAEGVSYRLDLSKPVGERIRDLSFRGAPLAPDARLRVAINSYRYAGGGGYAVFHGLPLVYQSKEEIAELILDYFEHGGTVPARAGGNWTIVPPEAAHALREAAREEAARFAHAPR